jgi:hypothetical protein
MTKAKETDVPVVGTDGANLPALPPSYKFMALTNPAIIEENLGGENINPFDLDRIKVPSGGGIAWAVPTLAGEDVAKTIEGVIVYWRSTRSYWDTPFTGEATPPTCQSPDGITGTGNPGGACALCPMAAWGSGKNGGQACKSARLLFVMQKDNILPMVVCVPPTSIAPMKKYFMRLASQDVPYHAAITSLALIAAQNKSGLKYSQIVPSLVAPLTETEAAIVRSYSQTIRGSLNQVALEQTDVSGE